MKKILDMVMKKGRLDKYSANVFYISVNRTI